MQALEQKPYRPLYRRWWFWVILIALLIALLVPRRTGTSGGIGDLKEQTSVGDRQGA
jgi:hypothetical protein